MCVSLSQDSDVDRYLLQVQRDQPALLLALSERKGSRRAANRGWLGRDWDAEVNRGCSLEAQVTDTIVYVCTVCMYVCMYVYVSSPCPPYPRTPVPLSPWQGPIPAEPFLRSFGFLPADQPHLDVRHHAALASPRMAKHFSLEVFFKCTGNKDLARYIVSNHTHTY